MASNFFEKIPSVSELLDSPPLKQWVDRASRNVVVTSVKSFVGRMASDLQSRASEMKVPTVSELAERIADWIASRRASGPHAEINATGVLLPDHASLPLAEEALHALEATLRDYTTDRRESAIGGRRGQQVVTDLARQLTGAEGCLVTGTHSGAMLLALAGTCGERPVVIARGEVGELEAGVPLPQIARCAGVSLLECGTVERVRLEDYEAELEGAGAILSLSSTRYAIAGAEATSLRGELAALARQRQRPLIVDLGLGGIVDPSRYGLTGIPHASAVLGEGADLVIMAGDRMLGGPSCGIILGRQAALQRLERHMLSPALSATPMVLLALAATLELHQDLETAERAIPLLALLATSPENLKHRAERLRTQLAASPLVASAVVREGKGTLLGRELMGQQVTSYEVAVEPKEGGAAQLAARLRSATPPIAAIESGQQVVLNLRTVLARQDMQIAETFARLSEEASAEEKNKQREHRSETPSTDADEPSGE